jgi:hypothetical protein
MKEAALKSSGASGQITRRGSRVVECKKLHERGDKVVVNGAK